MSPLPPMVVVIPTRERAETLSYTLRTVVEQNYDNLTIIVSDNCSNDETPEVVAGFRDPRIRYVRTPDRLSMTRNWEFALSQVESGFVTYIGDDDAVMPNAVADAAALLVAENVPALVWGKVHYTWPSYLEPEHRNKLVLPLDNFLVRANSREVARDCAMYWTTYTVLPNLYNAFSDVAAIRRVQKKTGDFFHSVTPDVYSGFAIASAIEEHVYISRPLSMNGASGRSNGASTAAYLRDPSAETEMARFVRESDMPIHPLLREWVPGSTATIVLEAMLQANDRCYGGKLPIDVKRAIGKIIREVHQHDRARYESVVAAMQRIFAEGGLNATLRAALRKYSYKPNVVRPKLVYGLSPSEILTFDTSAFGITNVYEAARFGANLLGPFTPPKRRSRYRHAAKYLTKAVRMIRSRLAPTVWD